LLNALEAEAATLGWAIISVTMREGTVTQLTETLLPALLNKHVPKGRGPVTGGSVSVLGIGGSITREPGDPWPVALDFRMELEELARALAAKNVGVFLSLDEIEHGTLAELREIFQAVQHCFRQGLDVAVMAAGLPAAVSDILRDDVLTFLRRAQRYSLNTLTDSAVAAAIRGPIVQAGRTIVEPALETAVQAVDGYPFMVQLVGFHLWESTTDAEIGLADAETAVASATAEADRLVIQPMLMDLSPKDVAFLEAMAVDDGPSTMADIEQRLGGKASQYRTRLIAAEVIEPAARGQVRFTTPGLRDYLRNHTERSE
jgi:hypothetical protein